MIQSEDSQILYDLVELCHDRLLVRSADRRDEEMVKREDKA